VSRKFRTFCFSSFNGDGFSHLGFWGTDGCDGGVYKIFLGD